MKTTVVIPNWNGREVLGPCLDSLKLQTYKADVIVVDNGSADGSLEMLENDYPWVRVVKLSKNYGFAGGVNRGIKPAIKDGAAYVVLLNNDAIVAEAWLEHLVNAAQAHPEAGIITSKFMRMDKSHLDSTGDFYSVWGLPFPRGRNEIDNGQYDEKLEVFGATGGASLYKASMFDEIGLFDEDFFAYYEDVDISFRAQLANWRVFYEPRAIAYHHLSATSSQLGDFARFHSAKNFILTFKKNMPLGLAFKYGPLFALQFLRMGLTAALRGKSMPFLKGTWAAIKLSPRTRAARKAIQTNRKVPVGYIDSILYHHRPPKPPASETAQH